MIVCDEVQKASTGRIWAALGMLRTCVAVMGLFGRVMGVVGVRYDRFFRSKDRPLIGQNDCGYYRT